MELVGLETVRMPKAARSSADGLSPGSASGAGSPLAPQPSTRLSTGALSFKAPSKQPVRRGGGTGRWEDCLCVVWRATCRVEMKGEWMSVVHGGSHTKYPRRKQTTKTPQGKAAAGAMDRRYASDAPRAAALGSGYAGASKGLRAESPAMGGGRLPLVPPRVSVAGQPWEAVRRGRYRPIEVRVVCGHWPQVCSFCGPLF